MDNLLQDLINATDIRAILQLMFELKNGIPCLKDGFHHERISWDFKSEVPSFGKPHQAMWADIARHVLAFHNAQGGLLIFGIGDKDFRFNGTQNSCDSAKFNSAIRKYVGDLFHVIFERAYIQADQRYLGVALIPGRGPRVVRFAADAPIDNGKRLFARGDIAVREGDSSRLYRGVDAENYISSLALPRVGRGYFVDEESFRILAPEFRSFVYRPKFCDEIMEGLNDPRTAVVSLNGFGGVGKTALATWAVVEAYRANAFSFIVSMTAKDRELTAKSIVPLEQPLTSYEELIDTIIKVLRIDDISSHDFIEKETFVLEMMEHSNGLLYVDNLETVDDDRIIKFLNKLPLGTRAIVTSRLPRITKHNSPVDVGPFENHEVLDFIEVMTTEAQYEYLTDLTSTDRLTFGIACNRIPLAMRWIAARCKTSREVMTRARDINMRSKTNDELLEFSFRRVFDQLHEDERSILKVLSVYRRPLAVEAIHIASGINYQKTIDILEELKSSSLLEIQYDDELNGNVYTMLPITSSFVYGEVRNQIDLEATIRKRMQDWLEAKDEKDPVRRAIARGLRQGTESSEEILLQLAQQAVETGAIVDAERLFQEAIKRYPRSWKAHRKYAEFLRHYARETGNAIEHYRKAAAYVPKTDKLNRPVIYRELGILLKKSGELTGLQDSIQALEVSLEGNRNDPMTANVLGGNYVKIGRYQDALKVLTPFRKHQSANSREYILRTLLECYEKMNEVIEVAYIRQEIREIEEYKKITENAS